MTKYPCSQPPCWVRCRRGVAAAAAGRQFVGGRGGHRRRGGGGVLLGFSAAAPLLETMRKPRHRGRDDAVEQIMSRAAASRAF